MPDRNNPPTGLRTRVIINGMDAPNSRQPPAQAHTTPSHWAHAHTRAPRRELAALAALAVIAMGAAVPPVAHALPAPVPEDWASGTTLHIGSDERGDTYTSAYINVSREIDGIWKWDSAKLGRYGGGYIGSASGVIVHVADDTEAEDHSGCVLPLRSTRRDRRLPDPGEPWIALIKRGRCNFDVKVENAYRSSAAGVLVYNDRDSSNLDKMKLSSENGRNISAVFTYKWKGEELARMVENDGRVLVHITIAEHTNTRANSINRTSVLFVSITFIVLMIISLAWLIFYYVQRFRYLHAKDRLSRRLCNAAKKALSKIPTKNIKSDDREIADSECCAICIEPYKTSDVLRILPCTHEFHKSCIDPWLLEHRTCPMCKMDILKHYGFVFTGSQESILHMEVEEVAGLDSGDMGSSPRRSGGISPLPQIRAVIVTDHQHSYGSSTDGDDHSRSSSPNELTPSLSSTNRRIAAAASRLTASTSLSTSSGLPAMSSSATSDAVPSTSSVPVRKDLCVSCLAAAAVGSSVVTSQQQPVITTASKGTTTVTAEATTCGGNSVSVAVDIAIGDSCCDDMELATTTGGGLGVGTAAVLTSTAGAASDAKTSPAETEKLVRQ